MSAALQNRPIAEIRIGHRHRRDLGDVDQLAASIADLGLLQPVVVRPDGQLIAGERRLRAAQLLGWKEIPVSIVDLTEIARGEYAENTLRKNFTLSEAVAIKRALEPLERAAAKERMLAGKPSGKFPKGRALDKVAKVVGKDRTTLAKAEAIVDAAEAEPEKFAELLASMDRSGRVNGAYRRLKNTRQAEQIAPSRHHCRITDLIASRLSMCPGHPSLTHRTHHAGDTGRSRPCRSRKSAPCPSRRSCTQIPSFGSGRRTFTCGSPSRCSTPGGFTKRRPS